MKKNKLIAFICAIVNHYDSTDRPRQQCITLKMNLLKTRYISLVFLMFIIDNDSLLSQWKPASINECLVGILCDVYKYSTPLTDSNMTIYDIRSSIDSNYRKMPTRSELLFCERDKLVFIERNSNSLLFLYRKKDSLYQRIQKFPDSITMLNGVVYKNKWLICTNHGILISIDKGKHWRYANHGLPMTEYKSSKGVLEPDSSRTFTHYFTKGMVSVHSMKIFHDTLIAVTAKGLFFWHENKWLKFNFDFYDDDYYEITLITNNILLLQNRIISQYQNDSLIYYYQNKKNKCLLPKRTKNDVSRLFFCSNKLFCTYSDGSLFVFIMQENRWEDCGQGLPVSPMSRATCITLYQNHLVLTTLDGKVFQRANDDIP